LPGPGAGSSVRAGEILRAEQVCRGRQPFARGIDQQGSTGFGSEGAGSLAVGGSERVQEHSDECVLGRLAGFKELALVGVPGVVLPVRFPYYSLGTRDVRLADVFRILKQGLDFFLYNASVFG
jgi:hypothetical protein